MAKFNDDVLQMFQGTKDPEVDALLKQLDVIYNKLFSLAMKNEYGADASVVDDNHIMIDGELLDDEGFLNWLIEHDDRLKQEIEDDEEWGEA